ncbi:MAG: hypothetical protein KME52_29615 [Desmonostoc geniculatum HA4340-LM1]|nr:hypothetical protein [Desmonostoc geniculatum HA4340-LM1]
MRKKQQQDNNIINISGIDSHRTKVTVIQTVVPNEAKAIILHSYLSRD